MNGFRSIAIDEIELGDRRREDNGDISALAKSIEQYGLLHPPVIDDQGRLVAGGRRLLACRSLGWTEIEVRFVGELSDAELREIELEENIRRDDLTPYEQSRDMLNEAKAKAEIHFEPNSVRNASNGPGRKLRGDSSRSLANAAGVTQTTIRRAQDHVEIAERFPFMQGANWKQYHALEAREAIAKLPEAEQDKIAALVDQPGVPPRDAIRMIRNVAEMPPQKRTEVFQLSESKDSRDRSLALTTAHESPPMPDPRLTRIERAIRELHAAVEPFPNDPETPPLQGVIATLRTIKARIRKAA